jgi:hypothetical protein
VINAENELLLLAPFEIVANGGSQNAPMAIGYYKVSAVVLINAVGVNCLIGIVGFVVPLRAMEGSTYEMLLKRSSIATTRVRF